MSQYMFPSHTIIFLKKGTDYYYFSLKYHGTMLTYWLPQSCQCCLKLITLLCNILYYYSLPNSGNHGVCTKTKTFVFPKTSSLLSLSMYPFTLRTFFQTLMGQKEAPKLVGMQLLLARCMNLMSCSQEACIRHWIWCYFLNNSWIHSSKIWCYIIL